MYFGLKYESNNCHTVDVVLVCFSAKELIYDNLIIYTYAFLTYQAVSHIKLGMSQSSF